MSREDSGKREKEEKEEEKEKVMYEGRVFEGKEGNERRGGFFKGWKSVDIAEVHLKHLYSFVERKRVSHKTKSVVN